MDSENSVRRWCHSRRVPATSASDSAAAMTIAPKVGCGTYCIREVAKTRTTVITAAPTMPGHLGPGAGLLGDGGARPAGADREALEEAGRDVGGTDADHLLVAPGPARLCGPRTPTPWTSCRRARRRRWRAPRANRGGTSPQLTVGIVNGGKPCGSTPIVSTPWDSRSNALTRRAASTTTTSTLGTLGMQPVQQQDAGQRADPEDGGRRLASPCASPDTKARASATSPFGIDGEPEELGQLADDDRQREPVHVADLGRLRQQVRDEPEPGQPGDHHHHADHHRQHRRERDGPSGVTVGEQERGDRRRDHRAQRRVGTEHQHSGGPEDRVPDQAQDRGVEPGHRRQPGQLGVRHPLRHQQRRQDEAGDDVLGQPCPLVRPGQPQTGHVLLPPGRSRRRVGR